MNPNIYIRRLAVFVLALILTACCAVKAFAGWRLENGIPAIEKLRGVRGYTDTQILAVGDYGTMLLYDGISWNALETVTDKTVFAAAWISENGAYAAADMGRMLSFDGTSWSMEMISESRLRAVWGAAPDAVFAAGENGTMLHFDGSNWQTVPVPTALTLQAVWGTAGSDVYAVGGPSGTGGVGGDGVMVHFDGIGWSQVSDGTYQRFQGVWGVPGGDVFVACDEGGILRYSPATGALTEEDSGTVENLRDIWGSSENDIFAVGNTGTVVHYDGTGWSPMDSGTSVDLFGVWVAPTGTAVAVGDSGTVIRYEPGHQDGDNASEACPFSVSVERDDDLTMLRALRDRRLAGIQDFDVVGLFYAYARETADVLTGRAALRNRLNRLVAVNRPCVQALIDTGRAVIDRETRDSLVRFLEDLGRGGGCGLRTALALVARGIRDGWLLESAGISVR